VGGIECGIAGEIEGFLPKKPQIPIPHQFEMTPLPTDFVYFKMFVFCNKNLKSENQNLIIS
jgi:hypothetical protein